MANAALEPTGQQIKLSNLEKVLWPEAGYTKGDLIDYYAAAAPYMIPHLRQRALVFTRSPSGIAAKSFYQKNAPENLPEWMETFPWQGQEGKLKHYVLVNTPADLVWLANQACIEIHPWMSRIDNVDCPDFMVFDLDPTEANSFTQVVKVANLLKELMDQLHLRVYAKTSGSLGLHVYLPLLPRYPYAQVRTFGQAVGEMICKLLPDMVTIERSVARRGPRIYFDYLQNGLGKTVCAPYCVRPRPAATVSAPIRWQELNSITPLSFTIKTMPARLKQLGDLFADVLTDQQELEPAAKALEISL